MEYEIRDVPLDDFPGYRVSFDGRVFGKRGGQLKPWLDHNGYQIVGLSNGVENQRSIPVAHLVLMAFKGPRPDGQEARHVPDATKTNNRADNLKWGTRKQNCHDNGGSAMRGLSRTGLSMPGESHPRAKLTAGQVVEIQKQCERGVSQLTIAKAYGVSQSLVSLIKRNEVWKCLQTD